MLTRLAISFLLFAAACGGGSKKPETTTGDTTAAVSASAGVELELGDIRLVDVNSNKAILVKPNGDIEFEGVVAGKVTKDGKIVNQNGEVGFTLNPDGTITGPGGKPLDVTLSSDAVVKSGEKTITLDATGALLGANPEASPMKIEGADTKGKQRTALFVLIAITTPDASADAEAEVKSDVEPAQP